MLSSVHLHWLSAFQLFRQDLRGDPNGLHRTTETSGIVPAGSLKGYQVQSALDRSDRADAVTVLLLILRV